MSDEKREWWTPAEVAERLRVSEDTIRREITDGRLAALQVRGRYRISVKALAQYERQEQHMEAVKAIGQQRRSKGRRPELLSKEGRSRFLRSL